MITRVFHEHGIPLGASVDNIALAIEEPLASPVSGGEWKILEPSEPLVHTKKKIGLSGGFLAHAKSSALPATEARLLWFTEQKSNWKLPLGEAQVIHCLSVNQDSGVVYILATSPSVLFSLNIKDDLLVETPLDRFIQSGFYTNHSKLQMATLKDQVAIFDPEVRTPLNIFYILNLIYRSAFNCLLYSSNAEYKIDSF